MQVTLEVLPIGTGLYPDRLVLTSPCDLRILDIEISARKLGHTYALTFDAQARESVTQEIPLINNSDAAMSVTAKVCVIAPVLCVLAHLQKIARVPAALCQLLSRRVSLPLDAWWSACNVHV